MSITGAYANTVFTAKQAEKFINENHCCPISMD